MKLYRTIHKPRADHSVTAYHYHRITGRRISADPGTPGWDQALADAGRQEDPGTVAAVAAAWQRSGAWRRLSRSTVNIYERGISHLADADLALPITALTARRVRAIRNTLEETPGIANQFVSSVSAMLTWAMRQDEWEGLEYNVCRAIEPLETGSWERWPEAQLAAFEAALDQMPRDVRLGWSLLLHTGQRRGDMLAMRWDDVDWTACDGQGAIRVLQGKTGKGLGTNALAVPLHPRLRVLLEAERDGSLAVTIVHDAEGRPYHSEDRDRTLQAPFYERCATWQRKILGQVFPLHGLRSSAAARLAEAGCTPHEIMGITGHRSLAMVQKYTAQAERHTGARAAMAKLTGRQGR